MRQVDCSVEDFQQGRYLVDFPYTLYRQYWERTGGQKHLCLTFIPEQQVRMDFLDLIFSPDPWGPDRHPYNPYVAV